MAWSLGSDGVFRHSGSSRDAVVSHTLLPAGSGVKIQLPTTAEQVDICVLGSQDLRWCFGVGVDGTNAYIRRVTAGRVSAADTPPTDILKAAAHGVSAGVPLFLEARIIDGKIQAYVNSVKIIEYDNSTNQIYATYGYWGLACDKAGGRVLTAGVVQLLPRQRPREDVLVMVGGSELWAARASGPFRVARVAIDPSSPVTIVEANQKAVIIGGGKALLYDPATETVTPFEASAGKLPGQVVGTDDVPGRTSATAASYHMSRLHLAGATGDPQNDFASAFDTGSDEIKNFDTGDLANPGRAFALSAERAGKIGQPIRGMISLGDWMLYGCDRSFWALAGDPVFDNSRLQKILGVATGLSGKDAMVESKDGSVLAHGPAGLVRIAGAAARYVSRPVLRALAELSDADVSGYIVILCRHPDRGGTHLFLTARPTADNPAPESTHLYFDETIPEEGELGGFFPDRLPASSGPTAACVWNGRMVCGTRYGRVFEFSEEATYDFDSTVGQEQVPIRSSVALSLIAQDSTGLDTLITGAQVVLGDDSGPVTYTVYGGVTAQEAFEGAHRAVLGTGTISGRITNLARRWRASAMIMVLSSNTLDSTWSLERVEINAIPVSRLMQRSRSSGTAPPAPCGPPGTGSGSGSGSGSGFVSGPGSGGSGFSGFSGSGSGSGSGSSSSGTALAGDGGSGIGSSVIVSP